MDGAAAHAQPVAQLCFGTGEKELNLRVVQQRIAELIRVIDSLLVEMQTRGSHWTGFLDKLAVINMTHAQIMGDLRPFLKQYTIYPKFVDNPGIEHAIPEMLASRLLPEQVEQEAAFKAALLGGLEQLAAQPSAAFNAAKEQAIELQEMVAWLTNLTHVRKHAEFEGNPTPPLPKGVLDPQSMWRREVDATSRQIVKAAAAAEKGRQEAGTSLLQPAPAPPSQKRRKPDPAAAAAAAAEAASSAAAVPSTEEEADVLIAKIMSGELWPKYKH